MPTWPSEKKQLSKVANIRCEVHDTIMIPKLDQTRLTCELDQSKLANESHESHPVKNMCEHKCAWEMFKGAAMRYVNIIKQFIHIDYELCTHDSEHVCGTS